MLCAALLMLSVGCAIAGRASSWDRRYKDMPDGIGFSADDIKTYDDVSSMDDCKDKCDDMPYDCAAVTWDVDSRTCHLKEEIGRGKRDGSLRSSIVYIGSLRMAGMSRSMPKGWTKVASGYSCGEKSLEKIKRVRDLRECAELCEAEDECNAVTYNTKSNTCYFKPSCDKDSRKKKDNNQSAWDK